MDLATYNAFLKIKLNDALKPLESNILGLLNHNDDRRLYRQVGARDMLVELVAQLNGLLEDFCKQDTKVIG